jgi:hypothetical protein
VKYVLLFCGTEDEAQRFFAMTPDQLREQYAKVGKWFQEYGSKIIDTQQLQPPSTATTVRRAWDDNGQPVVTDGPYIEAKEGIGGYATIDVADLDEALRMARSWPGGSVEIRPVVVR